jgi:hypothetical protein
MIRRLMAAPLALAVVLAPVAFAASSCACGSGTAGAATATGSGPGRCSGDSSQSIQPCSPKAVRTSTHGTISVAQGGPQQKVFWTVRATVPTGVYLLDVYVNGKRVDHKNQAYPPHATVVVNQDAGLPSGGVLLIEGTFTPVNDDPQEFYFKCILA